MAPGKKGLYAEVVNGKNQALTGCFYDVKLKTALPLASLSMPIYVTLLLTFYSELKITLGELNAG